MAARQTVTPTTALVLAQNRNAQTMVGKTLVVETSTSAPAANGNNLLLLGVG